MALRRDFLADPIKVGETWTDDYGFGYRCESVRAHTTRAGEPSLVIEWTGQCADCGAAFGHRSGAKVHSMPRRCPEHAGGRGWEKVEPFNGAKAAAEGGIGDVAALERLHALRKRLRELGDDLGASAVTLTIALYMAWREDPIGMQQPTADAEQHLRRALTALVAAAEDFEAPLTVGDLL